MYLLLLPEGQTRKAWELSKIISFSEMREHWVEEYFHSLFVLRKIVQWPSIRIFLYWILYNFLWKLTWYC